MRRRDFKKLNAGYWPPRMAQPLVDMRNAGWEVCFTSVCQAMSQETLREAQFVDAMNPIIFEAYKRLCEEGNTLLRFAEESSQEASGLADPVGDGGFLRFD